MTTLRKALKTYERGGRTIERAHDLLRAIVDHLEPEEPKPVITTDELKKHFPYHQHYRRTDTTAEAVYVVGWNAEESIVILHCYCHPNIAMRVRFEALGDPSQWIACPPPVVAPWRRPSFYDEAKHGQVVWCRRNGFPYAWMTMDDAMTFLPDPTTEGPT